MGNFLPGDILSDDSPELNDLLLEIVRDCIDNNVVRGPHEDIFSYPVKGAVKLDKLRGLVLAVHFGEEVHGPDGNHALGRNIGQFSCCCSMDPPDPRFNEVEGILSVYWWDISEIDTKEPFMDSEEFQEFGTNVEAETEYRWGFRVENGELHLAGTH